MFTLVIVWEKMNGFVVYTWIAYFLYLYMLSRNKISTNATKSIPTLNCSQWKVMGWTLVAFYGHTWWDTGLTMWSPIFTRHFKTDKALNNYERLIQLKQNFLRYIRYYLEHILRFRIVLLLKYTFQFKMLLSSGECKGLGVNRKTQFSMLGFIVWCTFWWK